MINFIMKFVKIQKLLLIKTMQINKNPLSHRITTSFNKFDFYYNELFNKIVLNLRLIFF